jgi:2',3'-cyclic-nucleotide 2'-phosphodiesterase (5'-nucleotidase family)
LLADWPAPAAALLLSGEQLGYLEPCGCSERQMGGLSRRADLADQLRSRGWAVTGFELGGTIKRTRPQSKHKFAFTRDALNTIGYKGLSLGLEDLRFDPTFLFEAHAETSVNPDFDLPFITANVTFFGDKSVGTPLSYRIVEVGEVRIGVTAVFGMSYLPELFPNGVNPQPELLQIPT